MVNSRWPQSASRLSNYRLRTGDDSDQHLRHHLEIRIEAWSCLRYVHFKQVQKNFFKYCIFSIHDEILTRRMTFVSNVNDMKEILRLRPKTFQRGQKIIAPIRAIRMGDGLFAAEGSTWSVHRRIVSPAFARQNISRWMDALWNEAENLVVMIKPSAEKGTPVDFAVVSTEFTIRCCLYISFSLAIFTVYCA